MVGHCRVLQASLRDKGKQNIPGTRHKLRVTLCNILACLVSREMWFIDFFVHVIMTMEAGKFWNETSHEHLAHGPAAAVVKTGSGAEELSAVDVAL